MSAKKTDRRITVRCDEETDAAIDKIVECIAAGATGKAVTRLRSEAIRRAVIDYASTLKLAGGENE